MKYRVRVVDDNNDQRCSFGADDQSGIGNLVEYVRLAAGTPGYERFKNDAAVVVEDQAGKEIARADRSTGWKLDPPLP